MKRAGHEQLKPGPSEVTDPVILDALKRSLVWASVAALFWLAWKLAQPILIIIGGLVFAALLDGGVRLLGRVLPIPRGWRLAIIVLAGFGFVGGTITLAGYELAAQAEELRAVIGAQVQTFLAFVERLGLMPSGSQAGDLANQLLGSLGQLTAAVGSALGAITTLLMIVVMGIFLAVEPRLYERGVAWMLPAKRRAEFFITADRVGFALRRLLAGRLVGMAVEGIGTWIGLAIGGVPMAALLGLLTGLLTFIPNIGAPISGVLMVLAGFSAGTEAGFWALGVYLVVQNVDGYLIMPMVAKKSVDLAPALVLAAQILFGALFGILGLALADVIVATIKIALERRSEVREQAVPASSRAAQS